MHQEIGQNSAGEIMPKRTSTTGSELFIVDNSDDDWKVLRYLHDWCQLSKAIDDTRTAPFGVYYTANKPLTLSARAKK